MAAPNAMRITSRAGAGSRFQRSSAARMLVGSKGSHLPCTLMSGAVDAESQSSSSRVKFSPPMATSQSNRINSLSENMPALLAEGESTADGLMTGRARTLTERSRRVHHSGSTTRKPCCCSAPPVSVRKRKAPVTSRGKESAFSRISAQMVAARARSRAALRGGALSTGSAGPPCTGSNWYLTRHAPASACSP